jgi:putative ABC transport system permease protein
MDLEPGYATALGFKSDADAVGKTVTLGVSTPIGIIREVTATVVGVQNSSLLASGGGMINNALTHAIYDIQTEGVPTKIKNQYVAVAVTVASGATAQDVQNTKEGINKLGYYALTVQDEIGTVATILNAITIALIGFGGVALIAASFGVINTLFMAVQERTKEIGLMKAMGMSGRRVFLLFSVEAILLGFWGSFIGVVAAFFAGQGINRVASATFLKDLKHFTLLEFPPIYIVAIIVVIMLIAYLAGTLPARRAAHQNPIDALRYE